MQALPFKGREPLTFLLFLLFLLLCPPSQVTGLQRNTSEVLYHSLSDRDLQIARWKQENEALKKSYALTTGGCSLRLPLLPPLGRWKRP